MKTVKIDGEEYVLPFVVWLIWPNPAEITDQLGKWLVSLDSKETAEYLAAALNEKAAREASKNEITELIEGDLRHAQERQKQAVKVSAIHHALAAGEELAYNHCLGVLRRFNIIDEKAAREAEK